MSARAVATNTISQIIGKISSAASVFFITLFLARSLGASGYGEITKALTFVAFFYLFADFGLNAAYIQNAASLHTTKSTSWNSLLTLRAILSLLVVFVAFAILVFLPSSGLQGYTVLTKIGIIIYIPTILFQGMITSANAVFQKQMHYKYATLAVSVGSLVSLFLVILSTYIFVPSILVFAALSSMAFGNAVTAFFGLLLARKYEQIRFVWDVTQMKSLFVRALPLGMMLFFDVIYFRADSVILTLFRSTQEVGIYGFAYKLFEFPLVIPTFLMNAVYPLMMNHHEDATQHILSLFRKSLATLFPLSLVIAVLFWFESPLVAFVKPEFVMSVSILRILSFGLPLFFASAVVLWTLIALKKQFSLVWIYGVSMALNIVANYLFIPLYGMTAAAIITLASEGFVLLCSSILLYKTVRL